MILPLLLVTHAFGHGSMLNPLPRNAADRSLPRFANGSWPASGPNRTDGCNCANHIGGCVPSRARPEADGQPCLWFSQGCSIGCTTCTGSGSHTSESLCAHPTVKATVNDPMQRTINRDVVVGSVNDTTRYNPWYLVRSSVQLLVYSSAVFQARARKCPSLRRVRYGWRDRPPECGARRRRILPNQDGKAG